MYDRILVPTDGSDRALEAADRAIELAAGMDATVHVLNVIEDIDAIVPPLSREQIDVQQHAEEYAEEITEEVADVAETAGVECVTAVEKGVPHEKIASYADRNDIGLIVIGSAGRTSLKDALLGSTAERVSRNADVPVMIIR